ncbi:hypothetical protein [Gallaecimonas sp. GXIMD4217]|uniref:hypothetical protein n=1 Tax=Gallaecimonas sp. GXIMD4217 TaxID=3131927 RepID=UPI00311B4283
MSLEKTMNIAVTVIAIIALVVSIWQGVVTREHNRLSLKPYLLSNPVVTGDKGRDGVFVSNDGVGPAFIKSAKIIINQEAFDLTAGDLRVMYESVGLNPDCFVNRYLPVGAVLKPSEEVHLISVTGADILGCKLEMMSLLASKDVELSIRYASAYDEEYIYKGVVSLNKGLSVDRMMHSHKASD